jgi:hypothetical protein
MDEKIESEVIKKVRESKLTWEKVPNRSIYRAETQDFVIYLDPGNSESMDLNIKRKTTSECCKIYRTLYNNKADWGVLVEIKDRADKESKQAEAYLLKEFLKDPPKEQDTVPKVTYVEDDLMDNTRTE